VSAAIGVVLIDEVLTTARTLLGIDALFTKIVFIITDVDETGSEAMLAAVRPFFQER